MSSAPELLAASQPSGHLVQLYEADERRLICNITRYLLDGWTCGGGLLVVAGVAHAADVLSELEGAGIDSEGARREGRLVVLDANETLARFMVGGEPDPRLFESSVGAAVRELQDRPGHARVRAYGEMVGLLWSEGRFSAAIHLERLWNSLVGSMGFDLFCAYPIDVFGKDFTIAAVDELLCAHTHLITAGTERDLESALNRAIDEILGPKAVELKRLIKANYRPSWAAVPRAEGIILWLRNNLPDEADEILARARRYYGTSHAGPHASRNA